MVGQLRQVEQVGGEAAHEFAGAVAVVEVEAQLLHMAEQVGADVRLHPDAEGMAVIADDVLQHRAQAVAQDHCRHDGEKGAVHGVGQHIIQGGAGNQGERQIDGGNGAGAQDVQGEQLLMIAEVVKEDRKGGFALVIFGGHFGKPPVIVPLLYTRLSEVATATVIVLDFL